MHRYHFEEEHAAWSRVHVGELKKACSGNLDGLRHTAVLMKREACMLQRTFMA